MKKNNNHNNNKKHRSSMKLSNRLERFSKHF